MHKTLRFIPLVIKQQQQRSPSHLLHRRCTTTPHPPLLFRSFVSATAHHHSSEKSNNATVEKQPPQQQPFEYAELSQLLNQQQTQQQTEQQKTVEEKAFEKIEQNTDKKPEQEQQQEQEQEQKWRLSSKLKAYSELMRLEKPIGTYLLLFPCLWSMSLADTFSLIPDPAIALSFALGAVVMRGAGCTINDIWDRKFDSMVERTKNRPIASGRVSVPEAMALVAAQVSVAASILLTQFNADMILACVASLGLVTAYPLMKRVTNWPQAFLGLTFNWGALVGFLAISGATFYQPMVTVPLYLAGICWTLVYDTIYAHQDKVDDRRIGVKSTALHFGDGDSGKRMLYLFTALFCVLMTVTGYFAQYDFRDQMSYYMSVMVSTAFLANMIRKLDLNNVEMCGQMFRANRFVGVVILLGIIGANFTKRMGAIRYEKERRELIEQGYDPEDIPVDEGIKAVTLMYKQLEESKAMPVVDKLKLVFQKLGFNTGDQSKSEDA